MKRKYRGAQRIAPIRALFEEALKEQDYEVAEEKIRKAADEAQDAGFVELFNEIKSTIQQKFSTTKYCPKCNRALTYGINYISDKCNLCRKWSLQFYKSHKHGKYGRKKRYRIRTTADFRKYQSFSDKRKNRFKEVKPHEKIHLRAEQHIDADRYQKKRYTCFVLKRTSGNGMLLPSDIRDWSVCGRYGNKHLATRQDIEKVTCSDCQNYIRHFIKT